MMTKETFTIWFTDGGGRETFTGRAKLRELGKRYSFNADHVLREGDVVMFGDEDANIVGGVFRDDS